MGVPQKKQITRSTPVAPRAPQLRVVKGRASSSRSLPTPSVKAAFYTMLVCVVLLASVAGLRVYIASQASVAAIEAASINTEIAKAYTEASQLEIKQSTLAQPERIKTYAQAKLDMGPALSTSHLALGTPTTQVTAQLPDEAFNNANLKQGNDANLLVEFVRSVFAPSKAGAALVSNP